MTFIPHNFFSQFLLAPVSIGPYAFCYQRILYSVSKLCSRELLGRPVPLVFPVQSVRAVLQELRDVMALLGRL